MAVGVAVVRPVVVALVRLVELVPDGSRRAEQADHDQQHTGGDEVGPQRLPHVTQVELAEQREVQHGGTEQHLKNRAGLAPHSSHQPTSAEVATATTKVVAENRQANDRPKVPA